jgi:chromate transport protein ChrA
MSTPLHSTSTSSGRSARRGPTATKTVVLAGVLDVVAILVFVAIGRRSHDESGSVVAGVAKVAAPFLIALVVGWLAARAWRSPTTLGTVGVIWVVTVAVGMVLRHTVFDKGTATSFVIVTAIVTFVLLFGWRAVANRVLQRGAVTRS